MAVSHRVDLPAILLAKLIKVDIVVLCGCVKPNLDMHHSKGNVKVYPLLGAPQFRNRVQCITSARMEPAKDRYRNPPN